MPVRGKRILGRAVVCAAVLLLAHATAGQSGPTKVSGNDGPIPREYWGLHIHRAGALSAWPTVGFGSWRLWDARVTWADLEPQPGQWRFEALDRYVELARERNVEILLPLGMSPAWASARPGEVSSYGAGATAEPADLRHWRNYVGTIARRYQGRVRHYEIWNEPNLKTFYTGSVATMVKLVREASIVLKEIDPAIVVVTPAATERGGLRWLDEFLGQGGAGPADVIGYHFYVAPAEPEAMVPLIREVQQILRRNGVTRPLWNTESGWMIPSRQLGVKPRGGNGLYSRVLDDDDAAGFVVRSYVLHWALGVSRLYWYAWDNHLMGLVEPDGRTIKTAGRAYETAWRWMNGAELRGCEGAEDQPWICRLTRGTGDEAWIVWSPKGRKGLAIPEAWRVRHVNDLGGGRRALAAGERVEIGPLPLLLER